jgi:hypothetical protein
MVVDKLIEQSVSGVEAAIIPVIQQFILKVAVAIDTYRSERGDTCQYSRKSPYDFRPELVMNYCTDIKNPSDLWASGRVKSPII